MKDPDGIERDGNGRPLNPLQMRQRMDNNQAKRTYVNISRPNLGGAKCTVPLAEIQDWVIAELKNGKIGEKIVLALCEMTEEEYEKLPEFQGW